MRSRVQRDLERGANAEQAKQGANVVAADVAVIKLPGTATQRQRKPVRRAPARACGSCGQAFRGRHCVPCERVRKKRGGTRWSNAGASFYKSARWRRIRADVLRSSPVCVVVGCDSRATAVDHIVPRRLGGGEDRANLQALCGSCHSRKTASEDGGFGNSRATSKRNREPS